MLVRNSIRSLTQIKCGESSQEGTLFREPLVWLLKFEIDEVPCVVMARNLIHNRRENTLLHVLHTGRFNGDDSWSLERLANSDNPGGYLVRRFEDSNVVRPLKKGLRRDEVFPVREDLFESASPRELIILRVAVKFISGGSGTMPRHDSLVVDSRIYRAKEVTPEELGNPAEISEVINFRRQQL